MTIFKTGPGVGVRTENDSTDTVLAAPRLRCKKIQLYRVMWDISFTQCGGKRKANCDVCFVL